MNRPLRIAVADDEADMRDYFRRSLPRLGHEVVGAARDGRELIELCREALPDLVITDLKMPEMDGIAAADVLCRERPVPVIVASACHEPALDRRAGVELVVGWLSKPIRQADLAPAIGEAVQRFERLEALRREPLAAPSSPPP
jgi:response regulator NasT